MAPVSEPVGQRRREAKLVLSASSAVSAERLPLRTVPNLERM